MGKTKLRIGEVAERAGVSIDALRYYERLKLLPRARRSSGGFRIFALECGRSGKEAAGPKGQ